MCYFVGGGNINLMAWMVPYEAYGNEAAYGAVMDSSKDTVVENLYATEEYRDYVLRMYKWRQDGIIEKIRQILPVAMNISIHSACFAALVTTAPSR